MQPERSLAKTTLFARAANVSMGWLLRIVAGYAPRTNFQPMNERDAMRNVSIIMRRELASYFATPLAYVFILIFLVLANAFTFYLGGFYERGQADLQPFFNFHPWLYLFLIPAISMKLWAEERKSGSIELLMTQPVTLWEAVLGKFFAAWIFTALAVALTFPLWITVNYLGTPDNGTILAAYVGSLLLAGGFLAIGSCMSALTRNQVVAFILGVVACFLFLLAGFPLVLDVFRAWAPQALVDAIASLSFLTHFESIAKGVIDVRDLLYFGMLIAFFLLATSIALELRKAD
jgi:ABC-2 type transport system permease protein